MVVDAASLRQPRRRAAGRQGRRGRQAQGRRRHGERQGRADHGNQQRHAGACREPREQVAVERIIAVVEKRSRTPVAALGDMVGITGDDDTSEAGHTTS